MRARARVTVAAAALLWAALSYPQTAGKDLYTVAAGTSRASFYAHATGHDFSGTTTDLRGHVRFEPASVAATATGEVRIKSTTLDTGIGKRNRDMWKLLETETHPDIVFTLERLAVEGAERAPEAGEPAGPQEVGQAAGASEADQRAEAEAAEGAGGPQGAAGPIPRKATLHGSLEVRGVSKPLAVPVELEPADAAVVVRGGFPLDIRDFGIEPPRAMAFIKMQPAVRIEFETRFQRAE